MSQAGVYTATDLRLRRRALGLTTRELADLVGKSQGNLSAAENGSRPVTAELIGKVRAVEEWVLRQYQISLGVVAEQAEPIVLQRLTAEQFAAEFPQARTDHAAFPVALYDLVLARVAAQLDRGGVRVRIAEP